MAQRRVIGNTLVKYDAHARHILGESTNRKLEEQLKNAIRLKHFSLRTEESYVGWYRRFALPDTASGIVQRLRELGSWRVGPSTVIASK